MLDAGYAWVFTKYLPDVPKENHESYLEAEETAKVARRGLWHENEPEAPWNFRKRKKAEDASTLEKKDN